MGPTHLDDFLVGIINLAFTMRFYLGCIISWNPIYDIASTWNARCQSRHVDTETSRKRPWPCSITRKPWKMVMVMVTREPFTVNPKGNRANPSKKNSVFSPLLFNLSLPISHVNYNWKQFILAENFYYWYIYIYVYIEARYLLTFKLYV